LSTVKVRVLVLPGPIVSGRNALEKSGKTCDRTSRHSSCSRCNFLRRSKERLL
jgi:hypothetical protein